jgi:SurA N-terminal domain
MTIPDVLKNKKLLYPSLAVLIVILGSIGYFVSHHYTIAVVNGESISSTRFTTNYRAAAVYYKNFKATYVDPMQNASSSTATSTPELTDGELKASVLTQLIEGQLVSQAAEKEVGSALPGMIKERTDHYASDSKLTDAARTLYGIGEKDFLNEVLIPQADADILRGRLFLKGQKFEDWLADAKKDADVQIFSDQFTWDGEKVTAE